MARSIAYNGTTVPFITLKGQIKAPTLQVEDISRPGVNGIAYRQVQTRGEPYELLGIVDCDTVTNATTVYRQLAAFAGHVCTVIDDYGSPDTAVCLDVLHVATQALVKGAGGLSAGKLALLSVRMRFVSITTAP